MNRCTLGKITHVDLLSATVWMFDKVELSVSPWMISDGTAQGFARLIPPVDSLGSFAGS